MERHGKLAPTREIAKIYKDLNNENNNIQNENEINFYDLNDSFIDDNEVLV